MSPRAATAEKAPPKTKLRQRKTPAKLAPAVATVDRRLLVDALARVAPAVASARSDLPVLTAVHIKSSRGQLTLSATNLDLWLRTTIAAETTSTFELMVQPKVLANLIRTAPDKVSLAPVGENDDLRVTFGKTDATLRTLSLEDWPTWRKIEGRTVTLSASDIAVVRRVAPFASSDDARPILTGILFADDRVVSTDSYRLVIGTVQADLGAPALFLASSVRLLPRKMLESETVEITVGEHDFAWEFDGMSVVTRLITGEFPNYKDLVPKASAATNRYTVNRADLIVAVKRAEAVIPKNDPSKPVRFKASGIELVVEANVTTVGVVTESVPAEVDGTDMSFAFNPVYFRECLGALTGEIVTIQMADCLRPAMMVEHDLTLLLMPVRVS